MGRSGALRVLAGVVLILFCITLIYSFFLPVYTDEITVKISRASASGDGFVFTSLYPQCGASSALNMPATWIPSAMLYGVLYSGVVDPVQYRVIGISTFALWLVMLAWFVRSNNKAIIGTKDVLAGLVALVSMGVLPFLLVLNRAEQALLLGLTFVCLIPLWGGRSKSGSAWYWILILTLFCFAASYMFYSHPKTALFIPLMLVSAFYLYVSSGRAWVGGALFGGLVLICYQGVTFWYGRMSCSDAPILDAILKSHSLPIGTMLTAPQEFFVNGMKNLSSNWRYLDNILFHFTYQSDWLPRNEKQKHDLFSLGVNIGVILIYFASVAYIFMALAQRVRIAWRERNLEADTTIPLVLLFCVISMSFLMVSRNFYETSLVLPLLILLVLILLIYSQALEGKSARYRYALGFLLIVSIASQLNLHRTFINSVFTSWSRGGQVVGQALSVSTIGYSQVRDDIVGAASKCGIQADGVNSHLVIDDSTYLSFPTAYRPIHATYISGFFGRDIKDEKFLSFLNQQISSGLITRCDKLSPFVRQFATASGDFCCISSQEIIRLGKIE